MRFILLTFDKTKAADVGAGKGGEGTPWLSGVAGGAGSPGLRGAPSGGGTFVDKNEILKGV